MKSVGSGGDDSHGKCPKCKQFIERVNIMAFRVDGLQQKLYKIQKFLADNEWIFIENAENMKTVRSMEDVDNDSFELTCRQILRFNRFIDRVSRSLETISNEGDSFCSESE